MSFFGFRKKKPAEPTGRAPRPRDRKSVRRAEVKEHLLQRAGSIALGFEGIRDNPIFRRHALALGSAVSTAVGDICFNELRYFNDPPFHADIWQRHESYFEDLAAFLAYQLVIFEVPSDEPNRDVIVPELLSVAATIYTASERAHRMIDRFDDLMRDPDEMRKRCILGVFAGNDDNEARGVVFAFIVNEIIGGPALELDVNNESKRDTMIDPSYSFWLRLWLSYLQIELMKVYREAVIGGRDVPLPEYVAAANEAMTKAASVQQVFG